MTTAELLEATGFSSVEELKEAVSKGKKNIEAERAEVEAMWGEGIGTKVAGSGARQFLILGTYGYHSDAHGPFGKIRCPICGKEDPSKSGFGRHRADMHTYTGSCTQCAGELKKQKAEKLRKFEELVREGKISL